jgi:hypothetical protein
VTVLHGPSELTGGKEFGVVFSLRKPRSDISIHAHCHQSTVTPLVSMGAGPICREWNVMDEKDEWVEKLHEDVSKLSTPLWAHREQSIASMPGEIEKVIEERSVGLSPEQLSSRYGRAISRFEQLTKDNPSDETLKLTLTRLRLRLGRLQQKQ